MRADWPALTTRSVSKGHRPLQHKLAEAGLYIDEGHVPVHDEVGLVVSRMELEAVAPDWT